MNSKLMCMYRGFKHRLYYKENYFRNIMLILLSSLLVDLLLLYLVW